MKREEGQELPSYDKRLMRDEISPSLEGCTDNSDDELAECRVCGTKFEITRGPEWTSPNGSCSQGHCGEFCEDCLIICKGNSVDECDEAGCKECMPKGVCKMCKLSIKDYKKYKEIEWDVLINVQKSLHWAKKFILENATNSHDSDHSEFISFDENKLNPELLEYVRIVSSTRYPTRKLQSKLLGDKNASPLILCPISFMVETREHCDFVFLHLDQFGSRTYSTEWSSSRGWSKPLSLLQINQNILFPVYSERKNKEHIKVLPELKVFVCTLNKVNGKLCLKKLNKLLRNLQKDSEAIKKSQTIVSTLRWQPTNSNLNSNSVQPFFFPIASSMGSE